MERMTIWERMMHDWYRVQNHAQICDCQNKEFAVCHIANVCLGSNIFRNQFLHHTHNKYIEKD